MPEALGISEPGRAALLPVVDEPMGHGRFRVQTEFSGISAGTELTFLKGTNPYLHARWDAELGVFRPGEPAQRYPVRRLGYMEVGRVIESATADVPAGARVAMAYGHRTSCVAAAGHERFVVLPDDLDPLLGIYVAHMGPICANGLLHAAADLIGRETMELGDGVRGRNVLVSGAGVVGLLVGLLAAHHGAAAVAVADVTPERLAAAQGLGLEPLDERAQPAWAALKERWRHGPGDRGADVVFQCRGRDDALAGALRALRPQGTVIDLAFYPGGAERLRLGEEFHHNGLSLRCAQIGRVPRGLAGAWSRDRLSAETLALLRSRGAAVREHLISDIVPFAQGPELLAALAERRRHVLQGVLSFPPGAPPHACPPPALAWGDRPVARPITSS